jgi:hypothetical protein
VIGIAIPITAYTSSGSGYITTVPSASTSTRC